MMHGQQNVKLNLQINCKLIIYTVFNTTNIERNYIKLVLILIPYFLVSCVMSLYLL